MLGEHKGFTETHQVAVDVSGLGGGAPAAEKLEQANIILNKNMLPWDTPDMIKNPSGLRIGVQEVTRIGMKEEEMREIAQFMARVLLKEEEPAKVSKDVIEFRKQFQKVHYTFPVEPRLLEKLML